MESLLLTQEEVEKLLFSLNKPISPEEKSNIEHFLKLMERGKRRKWKI